MRRPIERLKKLALRAQRAIRDGSLPRTHVKSSAPGYPALIAIIRAVDAEKPKRWEKRRAGSGRLALERLSAQSKRGVVDGGLYLTRAFDNLAMLDPLVR